MATSDHIETLSADDARRRRRLSRALGLALLTLGAAGLVFARVHQTNAGQDATLAAGATALARALAGEPGAFDEAEDAFRRSMRAVIVDVYPAFALEVTRQLAAGRVTMREVGLARVLEAMRAGRAREANAALRDVPDGLSRAWLERLLADMGSGWGRGRGDE